VKLVFLFLFLSLLTCSIDNTRDNLNKNLNFDKENLDYDKDYSIEEYEKILKRYNDRTDFPNIN
jgi:hypothetical protein